MKKTKRMSDAEYEELTKIHDPYGHISRFVGRRSTLKEDKIFEELEKVFAPAFECEHVVWYDWSRWQHEKMLRDTEENDRHWKNIGKKV